jgi:GntR family transcriptional regulator
MFAIQRGSLEPVWVQVRERLRERIEAGRLPAGSMVPSSIEMAIRLLCHPAEVERAYQVLIVQGWLLAMAGGSLVVGHGSSVEDHGDGIWFVDGGATHE